MALWQVQYAVQVEAGNIRIARLLAAEHLANRHPKVIDRAFDDAWVECDHSDTRACQALGHATGPSNEPS